MADYYSVSAYQSMARRRNGEAQIMELYKKGDEFLRIELDQDPISPREDENLGVMATWHRRYNLGDLQPKETPDEVKKELPKGTIILSLYMFDHSGISIGVTPYECRWDSGQIGFIYCTPEQREQFGIKESEVRGALIMEVEVYSHYLEGAVYGYSKFREKKCPHCGTLEEDEISSCWGFYGYDHADSGLLENAEVTDLKAWEEVKVP